MYTKPLSIFAFLFLHIFFVNAQRTFERINIGTGNNSDNASATDPGGNVWFSSDSGVFKIENDTISRFFSASNCNQSSVIDNINFDHNSNLLCATQSGACMYDGTLWRSYLEPYIISNEVNVFKFLGNKYYFGTNKGLTIYDGTEFKSYKASDGLSNVIITDININKEGVVWIGTINGLFKFNGSSFTLIPITNSQDYVNKIEVDQDNNLWISLLGVGLVKYNYNTFTTYATGNGSGIISDYISDLAIDLDNNVWISTDKGASSFNGTKFTNYPTAGLLSRLAIDNNNNVYFGTNTRLFKLAAPTITSYKSNLNISISVSLYPNPSAGSFNISTSNDINFNKIILTDLIGNLILETNESIISGINPGFYLANIHTSDGVKIIPVVVN